MKNKILVISSGIFLILILTGLNYPTGEVMSNSSKSVVTASDSKENPKLENCPYLQSKVETTCPFLTGKINDSKSSCPYLNGKLECPFNAEESQVETCPFLNDSGNAKKIYKTIKNISS